MTILAGWEEMTLALTAFFASHVVPARPAVRRSLQAHLGGVAYGAIYSAVSLAVLAWLIAAARNAPHIQLWDFELWQLWVPNIVMPFVCVLIAFGLAAPNPFSIAGRGSASFDPGRPGVAGITSGIRSSGRSRFGRSRIWSRTETSLMCCCLACLPLSASVGMVGA